MVISVEGSLWLARSSTPGWRRGHRPAAPVTSRKFIVAYPSPVVTPRLPHGLLLAIQCSALALEPSSSSALQVFPRPHGPHFIVSFPVCLILSRRGIGLS